MRQLSRLLWMSAVFTLFLAACGDEEVAPDEVVEAVKIVSFAAEPDRVSAGESVTLSWKTEGAAAVALTGNGAEVDLEGASAAEGSVTVAIDESTSFVLEATSASGRKATESLAVTVEAGPRPSIVSFEAEPSIVEAGGKATLKWRTKDADAVRIVDAAGGELDLGDADPAEGQVETTALEATTTFKLVASRGDDWAERTVQVEVVAGPGEDPRVLSFTADPAEVDEGGRVRLSWTTENAERIQLFEGLEEIDLQGQDLAAGAADVHPGASTTYRLVASKGDRSDENSLQVKVKGFPSVAMTVSPSPIDFGDETTIEWTTEDAVDVAITDQAGQLLDGGPVEPSGSRTISPGMTTTYRLTATGESGKESHVSATVEVRPVVLSFALVTDAPAGEGDLVALQWTTGGATSLEISNLEGEVKTIVGAQVASGSAAMQVGASGKFELVARSGRFEDRSEVEVELVHVPAIGAFGPTGDVVSLVDGTAVVRLRWTGVARAETLELDSDTLGRIDLGPDDLESGFKDVEIEADTSFTLTARNAAGFVSETADVRAVPMPEVISVSTWPDYVGAGEEVELTWATADATNVVIEANGMPIAGPHPASGSAQILVDVSTTFEVKAYNDALDFDSAIASVSVGAPQILSFAPSRAAAWTNSAITFEWASRGAGTLRLSSADGVIHGTSDRTEVHAGSFTTPPLPDGDHEFVLEVENASGAVATKTVRVRVAAGPSIESFSVSPPQLLSGAAVTVQWEAGSDPDGAEPTLELTASLGGPYAISGLHGTQIFTLEEVGAYLFTLEATTDSPGSSPAAAQASVSVFGPPAVTLAATPTIYDDEIHTGVELSWTSEHADVSLELFKVEGDNPPVLLHSIDPANRDSGTFLAPAQTVHTTYRIVATNGLDMTAEEEVTVNMQGTQVLTFTAEAIEAYPDPAEPPAVEIVSGDSVLVSWTTKRANHVGLSFHQAYQLDPIPDAFEDISALGSTPVPMTAIPGWATAADEGMGDITFPATFSFPFGGTNYTQMRVFTNGVATFDMSSVSTNFDSYTNGALGPNQSNARMNLAPFWDDLVLASAANSVSWLLGTDGGTGEQFLVVQWKDAGFFNQSGVSLSFQIVLHEDGGIDYRYGTMNGGSSNQSRADGGSATIGVSARSFGHKMLHDTYNVAVPGGLSNTSFRFSLAPSLPLSGSTTWTPAPSTSVVTRTATIVASGIGSETDEVEVTVHPRGEATLALDLPAGQESPIRNQPFAVVWTSRHATALRIEDAGGAILCTAAANEIAAGTCDLTTSTTGPQTFTAVAGGALGHEVRQDLEVIVTSADFGIELFEVSAEEVSFGEPVTLTWETGDADLLEITANEVPLALPPTIDLDSDSFVVPGLTGETTFVLTITNTGTGATRTATKVVRVRTFTLAFDADQDDVPPGTPVKLDWDLTSLSGGQPVVSHNLPMEEVTATSPFQDISGLPDVVTLTMSGGADTGNANVTFPDGFSFPYMGETHTAARVFVDGYVSFNTSASLAASNTTLPSTSYKQVHLAALWDDNHLRTGSLLAGPVGDTFVLQWTGVSPYYGSNSPTGNDFDLNFQIVLHRDGSFEYRYGAMTPPPNPSPSYCEPDDCTAEANGASATIGYQNPDGTKGFTLHMGGSSYNSASNRPFPGGLANRSFKYLDLNGAGSTMVVPSKTGTYEICASLDGYDECKEVTIVSEFVLNGLEASADSIDRGQSVTLTWSAKNGDTIKVLEGGTVIATEADVDVNAGSLVVTPTETTTYAVEVGNTFLGTTIKSSNQTVTVRQFDLTLVADVDTVAPGDPVTLTWTSHTFSGDPTVLTTPMTELTGTAAFVDISGEPDAIALIGVGDTSPTKRNVNTAVVDQPLSEFPFPFLGTDQTSVRISVDGYLSFGTNTTTTSSNQTIPNTSSTYNKVSLAPFWDDLNARTSGTVYFLATPTEYVVQWSHMSMNSGSSDSDEHDLNFQVVLRPDGSFQYRYGSMAGLGGAATSSSCHPSPGRCQNEANGASATIGYQNLAGTAGYQLHFGGTSNSASNFPFGGGLSGRAFQFTPHGGSGSVTVNPYDSRSYRICAISGFFVECTEPVAVESEWKIVSFTPSASAIPVQSPVTLSWQTLNADSLKIFATVDGTTTEVPTAGLDVDADSVTDVLTGDTTYRLEIESKGRYKSASITVEGQTVDVTFTADRYSVLPGEVVTFTWDVTSIAGGTPVVQNGLEFLEVSTPYEDIVAAGGATLVPNLGLGASTSSGWGTVDFTASGFSFPYYGQTYDQIRVGNQGILSFDTTLTGYMYANREMPSTYDASVAKVAFALFWGDVQTASSSSSFTDGGVYSKFMPGYGPSGIDAYIIQYHHHRIYSTSTTDLNFQLVLFEDGTFEYRYGDMLPLTGTNTVLGGAKTVGYQQPGGAVGNTLHFGGTYTGSPSASSTFPGGFSGRSFRYEPLPASGSKSLAIDRTTTFEICAMEGEYSECETVTIEVTEEGDVAITEVMVDPTVGPSGQWVEVRNLATAPIDLAGWRLESDGGSHTILNTLVVPPGGFATIAASPSVGFAPDDVWGASMSLDPVADELRLVAGSLIVSSVEWDASWGILPDASIVLDPSRHLRGSVSHGASDWCIGSGAGSPGALGQGCRYSDYDLDPISNRAAIDISAIGVAVPGVTAYLTTGSATLSFPFPFFDATYTDVAISSNGFVAMVPSLSSSYGSNGTLPSTSAPASHGIIAPFWDEMSYDRHRGSFRMAELEVGGQQVAVLQWNDHGPWSGSTSKATFQAQLWENGDIVFVYLDLAGDTTTAYGSSATVGIQAPGSSGTPPAVLVSYNQPVLRPGMSIAMIKK
ncbi:MAG TPA: lamin tail domain-containing protein [Vulgatibacter sp.]|nr:lamin tail domain-containing protein [Vulgatibacter sp.]